MTHCIHCIHTRDMNPKMYSCVRYGWVGDGCNCVLSNPLDSTNCNTLQHTTTHYNTLQHTATRWNTLQHTCVWYDLDSTHPATVPPNIQAIMYVFDKVTLLILMSHVANGKDSCRTGEWVMSHIWISHVPHVNKSCPTYERILRFNTSFDSPAKRASTCAWMWMRHVAHLNESWPTCEWVMSHLRMNHVPYVSAFYFKTRRIAVYVCKYVMVHMWVSHVAYMNESCPTCGWVMSHMLVHYKIRRIL